MAVEPKVNLKMGKATRDAFGAALREAGRTNPDIVVVDGDVNNSTRTEWFAQEFPERFINVGIAESNLVGIGAGLAACGKLPVIASFACFIMCNGYDQLRMSIAFPNLNVKVVGSHAGISIGEDGPSQMAIEDVALALGLPTFTVIVPADEPSTHKAVAAMLSAEGPAYMRVGRPDVPVIYGDNPDFTLGKANELRSGGDITLISNGIMVAAALEAAQTLAAEGVQARVLDMHTVRPLDVAAVTKAARETGKIVVAEEHLVQCGLGSVVAMAVVEHAPCAMAFVGVENTYAESGDASALLQKYGLTAQHIVAKARSLL
ncbi:MAG: transketolase family protein [Chloroflexi bacterium]|nr:transketolase family protein [Chloroflexota bacterium]